MQAIPTVVTPIAASQRCVLAARSCRLPARPVRTVHSSRQCIAGAQALAGRNDKLMAPSRYAVSAETPWGLCTALA
eukprot:14290112-Ditylum_brightwellii.AAC.1